MIFFFILPQLLTVNFLQQLLLQFSFLFSACQQDSCWWAHLQCARDSRQCFKNTSCFRRFLTLLKMFRNQAGKEVGLDMGEGKGYNQKYEILQE